MCEGGGRKQRGGRRTKEQTILKKKADNKTTPTHCFARSEKLDGRRRWVGKKRGRRRVEE